MKLKEIHYLRFIKMFQQTRDIDFPEEHLGIGDRMIYNQLIISAVKSFYKDECYLTTNPALELVVFEKIENFGFKPKKQKSMGDFLMEFLGKNKK